MTEFDPSEEEAIDTDPLGPDEAPGVALIVQMRIYDALMAILSKIDPSQAELLSDIHRTGSIVMSSPRLNGTFIDDEQNAESTVE